MTRKQGEYKKSGSIRSGGSEHTEVPHFAIAFKLMLITAVLTLLALMLGPGLGAVIISLLLTITVIVYVGITPSWHGRSVWLMGTSNEITWQLPNK